MTSTANALSIGRWGVACAAVRDTVFFVGGKVVPWTGVSHAYMVANIDTYTKASQFALSSIKLSDARESTAVLDVNGSLAVAGGFHIVNKQYGASTTVDVFRTPLVTSGDGGRASSTLAQASYDVGATAVGGTGYVVDGTNLYTVDRLGRVTPTPLPPLMARPL